MIRFVAPPDVQRPERFAVETLVDLARLVPVDDQGADVVDLEVAPPVGAALSVRGCRDAGWHLSVADGRVGIPRDVLALVTRVVGAAAEQGTSAADRHGRVPSSANALVAEGLAGAPTVSVAAAALRSAVCRAAGRRLVRLVVPWPGGRRWAAAFTHDLDVVSAWPVFTALRVVELVRKGHLATATRSAAAAARAVAADPVLSGVAEVLAVEAEFRVTSSWFILSGSPTLRSFAAGDLTYRVESPRARRALAAISAGGHELGLHGSFATMLDAGRFREQKARLERAGGRAVTGVRQHFLRMRPGHTHRAMADAGFAYDATYGFPDRNGFRLGVADVVPVWDDAAGQGLPIDAVPLTWMDRALSKYQGVEDPGVWVDEALALARAVEAVEGLWVGLWHPNLVAALGFVGAPAAYRRLVRTLCEADPYVAPLAAHATWRRARRSVRVASLALDGRGAEFTGRTPALPVHLEDARGFRDQNFDA